MGLKGNRSGIGREQRESTEVVQAMPVPLLILIPAQNPLIPAKFPISNPPDPLHCNPLERKKTDSFSF